MIIEPSYGEEGDPFVDDHGNGLEGLILPHQQIHKIRSIGVNRIVVMYSKQELRVAIMRSSTIVLVERWEKGGSR